MIGLTSQQARCLGAIRKLSRGGVSPSYDDLKGELGLSSKGNVHRLVTDLKARGAITFKPGHARSIRILDDLEGLERHTTSHLVAMRALIDDILRGRGH